MWWWIVVGVALSGPRGRLERQLDRLLDDGAIARSTVAVEVVRLADGAVLYERNGQSLVTPASVTKAWTAVAALDALGPAYSVQTRVLAAGSLQAGVLTGDLAVVGAGDPTLGDEDPQALLAEWARAAVDAGITEVRGDVVVDGRIFDMRPLGRGWAWDDALWRYSAPVTGLQLHHNTATLHIASGAAAGDPVRVRVSPLSSCIPVTVTARTVAADLAEGVWVDRAHGSQVIVVGGTPEPGDARALTVTIPNPEQCVADSLFSALTQAGVTVTGSARVATDDEGLFTGDELAQVTSPSLEELLEPMLVDSDNLVAESVARWLDPAASRRSYSGAETVIRDTLRRAGVADDAVALADGSGLSRYGLASADALTRVFVYADRQPWRDVWWQALPVAGREGTLTRRMVGGPAEGVARGKTGSMTGVFNLVVYVRSGDGQMTVVAAMSNGVVVHRDVIRALQDRVVDHVAAANLPGRP